MADVEKVINGLECCIPYESEGNEHLCIYDDDYNPNCPYRGTGSYGVSCMTILMRDALALLKAQEAVEPVLDIDTWKCGNCGHTLEHQELLGDNVLFHEQYNYCPECGRAVKLDG